MSHIIQMKHANNHLNAQDTIYLTIAQMTFHMEYISDVKPGDVLCPQFLVHY